MAVEFFQRPGVIGRAGGFEAEQVVCGEVVEAIGAFKVVGVVLGCVRRGVRGRWCVGVRGCGLGAAGRCGLLDDQHIQALAAQGEFFFGADAVRQPDQRIGEGFAEQFMPGAKEWAVSTHQHRRPSFHQTTPVSRAWLHWCESHRLSFSRAESSRCRGVLYRCNIPNRHSFARPALPGVIAHTSGSDFQQPQPMSSLIRLVHRCPPPADRLLDLPGYHVLSMSGSIRPRTPGSLHATDLDATWSVACRGDKPVGTLRHNLFGALHLQGRLHPLPLHLACFRAYASTRLLPVAPQGSILGSRLTITQAGLPPADMF